VPAPAAEREELGAGDLPPRIRVAPPGPRSRELSRRLAAAEAPGANTLGPGDRPAIVWRAARGVNVLDVDGNRYVDLTSGFGVAAIGHRHPAVIAAFERQAGELLHGMGDVAAHPARVALAERLAALAPVEQARVHFAVSGADAVELAAKVALLATGRPRLLAFEPAYHGLSLGALAATSRPAFRAPFAAQLRSDVDRLPFGAPEATLDAYFEARGGELGAVLVEPVVGREGVRLPPAGWLARLAGRARRAGALLIADEIFTGFGRTGRLFAVEHEGVRPDLLCCGKALAGGLPIGAVVGRAPLFEALRTGGEALHTGTFLAHPLACAAALATLEVLESERLIERAAALGERLAGALAPPVRAAGAALAGRGALWGIDLGAPARAAACLAELAARGVLALGGGAHGGVVELAPPLGLAGAPLESALGALEAALGALGGALARLESSP
jgi:4-aminobutyrate aminotransferase-like enzyme